MFNSGFWLLVALCLVCNEIAAQSGDRMGEEQQPPPAHLEVPPAPALSAEDALKTFSVAPGFRIEIVASDPLVFDPVAMSIGADGRIWVVEMRAFMPNVEGRGEDAPIGTVAVLEDTNRDGRMDKRTEFAGGFVLPRAVAAIADGVLVAEPPNLWFLRDTNGDDKADERIKIADDYGNPANPEHTANGLMWALDNWIYSANHTVRFRYDAGRWTRQSTSFRGQWGITQDDYGHLFYNSNSDPLRMDVLPAEYLRRNPDLVQPRGANVQLVESQDLPVWPGRVTVGVNRGYRTLREDGTLAEVTAACGPVIYRGTLFPESFHGNAFIAEPAGNLVKRVLVEQRDGIPSARNAYVQTEFLTSTDERFRPVNLFNGPDGALYVVDMYRGIIQHRIFLTTYLRNQIKERRLEVPVGMGRIYRIVPNTTKSAAWDVDLAEASSAELVATLAHPQGWRRDTAQRLLVERQDTAAVPQLRALVKSSPSARARLHALWTLDGMNAADWESVQRGLHDADVHVAVVSARLSERFFTSDPTRTKAALQARAQSGEALFLRQLALSLGAALSAVSNPMLLELAQHVGAEPYMADAIASSLARRELQFFELIVGRTESAESVHVSAVLATLTAAILKSGNHEDINRLLSHLQRGEPGTWIHRAVLDGIEHFIPGEDAAQRTVMLAKEPTALIAFAAGKSEAADRALNALEYLRWRGQPIDPAKSLAALTDEQRELFRKGRKEFAVCAACHQPEGEGMEGLAPPLVGSDYVNGGPDALIRIVLNGKLSEQSTMPPLRTLDNETIAAILTYIRRSWGHAADPISPAQVHAVRSQVKDREEPWSDAELEPMNQ